MMPLLAMTMLGTFEVALGERPITTFEYDKVRALLAYLVTEVDRPQRRETLAGLFWPERSEARARQNLSQTLLTLRHAIGDYQASPPFLRITPQTIQFNPASNYQADVTDFLTLLANRRLHPHPPGELCPRCLNQLHQAVALYRGGFLAGFSLADSPAFEEWVVLNRERLHRLAVEALEALATTYEHQHRPKQALPYAWRRVDLEPWQETGYRQLMRLLAGSGQRESALVQYEKCRQCLAAEFGVEPAAETTRLFDQIRLGQLEPNSQADQELRTQPLIPIFLPDQPSPPPALQPFDSALGKPSPPPHPFVAREYELVQLDAFLTQALANQGQIVFVTGGPGRGKTSLMQAFARRAQEHQPDLLVLSGRGNALTGGGEAYRLFREILDQVTGEGPKATGLDLQPQKDVFEQPTRVLPAVANQQPLLVLLDDLQWADAESIGLLFELARSLDDSRILIVAAYRPAEVARGRWGERHPLEPVVNELKLHLGPIEINLSRAADRPFVDAFIDSEPNDLSEAFRETLFRLTGGHPLFTVEWLRGMQDRRDLIQDQAKRWIEGPTLDWETLPARVEAAIAERIGQLTALEQELLTIASVEGEIFTAEVVAHVQGLSQSEVVHELSTNLERIQRLVRALGVCERNGRRVSQYRFRHLLIQKYLYHRLDPVERVYLHEAVTLAFENLYGAAADKTTG